MIYDIVEYETKNDDNNEKKKITGPNFTPDPQTRRKASGRPTTNRIHNEMDQPVTDKPKKCSYCRTEGHHRGQCPFRQ